MRPKRGMRIRLYGDFDRWWVEGDVLEVKGHWVTIKTESSDVYNDNLEPALGWREVAPPCECFVCTQ